MKYSHIEFTPEGVKEFRKSLGLTQKEFGERIGVSQPTVSIAENDPKGLTVSYAERMMDTFDNWGEQQYPIEYMDPKDLPIFKRIRLAIKWIFGGEFRTKTGFRPMTFDAFVTLHERGEL